MLLNFELHEINFFQLVEEPGVDAGHFRKLLDRMPLANGVTDVAQALGVWSYQPLCQDLGFDFFRTDPPAGIERSHPFHQRLFEGAAYGHDFADRLHLWAEIFVSPGEFFKLPLGNFDDNVIEGWLKAGGSFAGNVVSNLV